MTQTHVFGAGLPRNSASSTLTEASAAALTENLEREAREAGVVPNLATALVAEGHLTPTGEPTHPAARLMTVPLALNRRWMPEFITIPFWRTPGSADGAERVRNKMKAIYWKRRRAEARKLLFTVPLTKACVGIRRAWAATLPFWYVVGLTMAVTVGTIAANLVIGLFR
jgi:hypothetical protein